MLSNRFFLFITIFSISFSFSMDLSESDRNKQIKVQIKRIETEIQELYQAAQEIIEDGKKLIEYLKLSIANLKRATIDQVIKEPKSNRVFKSQNNEINVQEKPYTRSAKRIKKFKIDEEEVINVATETLLFLKDPSYKLSETLSCYNCGKKYSYKTSFYNHEFCCKEKENLYLKSMSQ